MPYILLTKDNKKAQKYYCKNLLIKVECAEK